MKQTAIEWLVDKLSQTDTDIYLHMNQLELSKSYFKDLIEQAKAMEKEQIIKASAIAYKDMFGSDGTDYGEKYYNKTFKS